MEDTTITKFGVELEICVRVGPECIKYEGTKKLSNIDHRERFDMYFKYILVPNARANPDLIRLFPLICYNFVQMQPYIYDLRDPFEADGQTVRKHDPNPEEADLVYSYALPIFTDDPTVVCGDADAWNSSYTTRIYNNTLRRHQQLGDSIGFEMISPVLEIRGEATPAKITESLHPLLFLFGMNRTNCFMSNFTSGFHVNVSIERDGSVLPITKTPLIHHIMKEYIDYETENYALVRSKRPLENPTYTSHWAKPMQRRIKPENKSYANIFTSNFLKIKEGGLKIKDDEILEFRLFQSESDIELLEKYTRDAIRIVHKGVASSDRGIAINPNEYHETIRGLLSREELRMHGPERAAAKSGGRLRQRLQAKTERKRVRKHKRKHTKRNGSRDIRIRNATCRRAK